MRAPALARIGIALAVAVAIAAGALYLGLRWYGVRVQDPTFFEDDIVAFEQQRDVPERAVVFIGSSSIRLWDTLARDMAPLAVVNRGFGGSQMFHLVHYAERIVGGLDPAAVVVYAGDNDLAAGTGKSPEDVLRDYQAFVSIVKRVAPDAPIYFLTIKPSQLRWDRWPEMSRANRMITAWSRRDPLLSVIDTTSALLGPDGTPRDEAFVFDGLHLSEDGYAGWTEIIRPALLADLAAPLGLAPEAP